MKLQFIYTCIFICCWLAKRPDSYEAGIHCWYQQVFMLKKDRSLFSYIKKLLEKQSFTIIEAYFKLYLSNFSTWYQINLAHGYSCASVWNQQICLSRSVWFVHEHSFITLDHLAICHFNNTAWISLHVISS